MATKKSGAQPTRVHPIVSPRRAPTRALYQRIFQRPTFTPSAILQRPLTMTFSSFWPKASTRCSSATACRTGFRFSVDADAAQGA